MQIQCAYCGAKRLNGTIAIGAAASPDWYMVEKTGKITCPICYDKAMAEKRFFQIIVPTINVEVTRVLPAGWTFPKNN